MTMVSTTICPAQSPHLCFVCSLILSVRKWEDHDIACWLQSARLGAHAAKFAENDIRGSVVLDVDQAALKEMGITSVGDRVRLFAAIKALNKRCADAAATAARHRRGSASSNAATSPRGIHFGLPRSDPYRNGSAGQDGEIEYLENDHYDSVRGDEVVDANGAISIASGSGRRGQMRPPPLLLKQSASRGLPGHASPVGSINNGQGFGLSAARGLTPGSGRGSVGSRNIGSTSKPMPAKPGESTSLHRKVNSTSGSGTNGGRIQHGISGGRPSTATGAGAHPSGRSVNSPSGSLSSPTGAGFAQATRPSTASGVPSYGMGTSSSHSPLTPINEANSYSGTPTTPAAMQLQQTSASSPSAGYAVGRGPFTGASRPITPGREWASTSNGNTSSGPVSAGGNISAPPTLEDLKRRTIKFISEEDRTTRIVNVSDCRDAYDVMARVLKKFGKPASGNSYTPTADQGPTGDDLGATETWGIFATSADGQNTKALSDNELMAICHAPQPHDPLRERGLTLRRIPNHLPGEDGRRVPPRSGRHKLEAFFGERMPVNQMLAPPASPREGEGDAGSITISGKKMKRASTVSIMSGLGVGPFSSGGSSSNNNTNSSNTGSSGKAASRSKDGGFKTSQTPGKPSKFRNFFGQRPPSELINTNLADFFPSTEPKALQRTARRSIYGRASASTRSKRNSTWSFTAEADPPPLPTKESMDGKRSAEERARDEAPIIHIGFESRPEEISERRSVREGREGPPTLPPIVGRSSLDDWSKGLQAVGSPVSELHSSQLSTRSTSSRPGMTRRASGESARSRRSVASQVRHGLLAARERGDAASLLTVDEITQEVEQRRQSMGGSWVVDEDGVPIPIPGGSARNSSAAASTRPSSGLSSHSEDGGGDVRPDSDLDEMTTMAVTPGQRRPSADAPRPSLDETAAERDSTELGDEANDSLAVTRTTTSGKSSVSELAADVAGDLSDGSDFTDDSEHDDEDDDDDDDLENEKHESTSKKPTIKWHKGALIGAGSFGNVFLGMNAKTGLLMAVKQVELPSGDSHNDQRKKNMLEALEREIKLLKTLQHENIVQYLDSFADGTHLNIFLEYVPGGSIVALLRNYGAFEEPLVRNFVRQILQGLSFLHAREIVHRDIKGANILVDNKGGIKISDFGISKKVESDLLVSARAHRPSLQGSVFWMAPEVVKQTSYTRKADIWSLGCLVVEMISGTHPWAELNQMQALFQIGLSRKPSLPDEVSSECIDFLNSTFEIDYTNRPSADELLQHAFLGTEEEGSDDSDE